MSEIKTTEKFRKNLKKIKNKTPGTGGGIYLSDIPLVPYEPKKPKIKEKKNVSNNNNRI